MKRLEKAKLISDDDLEIKFVADECLDEEYHLFITSSDGESKYFVTYVNGLWRCDCKDFETKGLHQDSGSFCCKHILKAMLYLSTHELNVLTYNPATGVVSHG